MKCLDKDRTRRYETANGLAHDILCHLNNEPVLARPPSKLYRFQKLVRRNKVAFASAALMAVVLVAATGISVWQAVRATRAETLAKRAETLAKQRLTESEAISKFLTDVFQSPDPARDGRTITVAETLGAAVKKLETDLANQPERRANLQATLAWTYHTLGLDREAIPLQEKVRDYRLAAYGLEHRDTLRAMHTLAILYDDVGRRDEALKLREQVLALSRKVMGPEHSDTLWAMFDLASSFDEAGRRDEALKLQEEVLALRRKVSGPEDPATLLAMNDLANLYEEAGRQDEAFKLREGMLTLSRKVNGPEHLDTVMAMSNLAISYDEAGRRDEALKLREQVLALRRKVLGPENPDTLVAMGWLAVSYDEAGRTNEAIKLWEEVLPLSRKVSGPEDPATLLAMNNLANLYDRAGRRDEALKLREEVLAINRKVGSEHPDTLVAMEWLAVSYDEAGRRDEALKLREQVLALRRKVLGSDHPATLNTLNYIARTLAASDALEIRNGTNAVRLAEEAVAATSRTNANFLDTLAAAYAETHQFGKAVNTQNEAIALLQNEDQKTDYASRLKLYQLNTPYRDDGALAANTLTLLNQGKFAQAEPLARECLALREIMIPDDWRTFNARSLLGGCLLGQMKYAEAEPLLLSGYEGLKQREDKILPAARELRLREALQRLAQLDEATGRPEQAAEWRKRLAELETDKK